MYWIKLKVRFYRTRVTRWKMLLILEVGLFVCFCSSRLSQYSAKKKLISLMCHECQVCSVQSHEFSLWFQSGWKQIEPRQIWHASLGVDLLSACRGALSSNCATEEHLTLATCLREKVNASGLHLPAHLRQRLHIAGKQEGRVLGLRELDS